MNFFKYAFVAMTAVAVVFAILFFTHKCKECPEIIPHVDTAYLRTKVDTGDIKLIKKVSNKSIAKKDDNKIIAKDSLAADKKSFTENIDFCDSLQNEFESESTYQIPVKDSMCTATATITISKNKPTSFVFDAMYRHETDTIVKNVPMDKKCLTFGIFGGGAIDRGIAGISLGYRWRNNHLSGGYDFINKFKIVKMDFDLK